MNWHKFMTAPLGALCVEDELAKRENWRPRPIVSPEIQKISDAMALDELRERDPQKTPQPIAWIRIYQLPDFVYFNHSAHVSAGVACQQCHGPIETMDRSRQEPDLSMGWCVNCHRIANATGIAGRQGSLLSGDHNFVFAHRQPCRWGGGRWRIWLHFSLVTIGTVRSAREWRSGFRVFYSCERIIVSSILNLVRAFRE